MLCCLMTLSWYHQWWDSNCRLSIYDCRLGHRASMEPQAKIVNRKSEIGKWQEQRMTLRPTYRRFSLKYLAMAFG